MWRTLALVAVVSGTTVFAQMPPQGIPPVQGIPPLQGVPPSRLPEGVIDLTKAPPKADAPRPDVVLPMKEQLRNLDHAAINVRRVSETWQVTLGYDPILTLGKSEADAEEVKRVFRELRGTQFAMIGFKRPLVGYTLVQGEATQAVPPIKSAQALDLKTLRAEMVRGVWVVRDDRNFHLNAGSVRADAEQAVAVAQRYGFNHIGHIGKPNPAFSFFFAAPPGKVAKLADPIGQVMQAQHEQNLMRTGISVPGLGFVGEQTKIDPRKLEVRRDKTEYQVVSGVDVVAQFGGSEWAARDATRFIQENRFTEFCQLGEMSFFLINGQPPTKIPFQADAHPFQPKEIQVRTVNKRSAVCDGVGREIIAASSPEEAEAMVKVIQGFQFDRLCRVPLTNNRQLTYFVKSSAR
ncbi:MAG: hypothetical protein ACRC8S_15970 [Fimbriiglobus sp.]